VSRIGRADVAFGLAALVAVSPFVLHLGGTATGATGTAARLYLGNLSKLTFLVLAAASALRVAARLEAGNPMRGTWRTMAAGFVAFAAGQAVLFTYQVVLRLPSPFPSLADVFFVASYPLLLTALVRAIGAYAETGYPIGTTRERTGTTLTVAAAAVVAGYPALKPVIATPAPALEKLLNVAYPVLDLAVLVPVFILLRIAIRFRGGEVWKVWAGLLTGFMLMCVGDVLFAYLTAMGQAHLDPLIHVMYILSYACLARGALGQYELLR